MFKLTYSKLDKINHHMTKVALTVLFFSVFTSFSNPNDPTKARTEWVAEKMAAMTLDEKIGQMIMIRAHSNLGPEHIAEVERQIKTYKVGSLCFFQGTPLRQAELTNQYQEISEIPLMIAIDGEWGLGMRFPQSSISFPRQLMLGAIQDNHLIYEMGKEIAHQMKRIGVHVNFAPVVDVNNNADNPVINDRSFGEDRNNVASKSYAYMKGMQDNGLMACAKHFPGHGDTDVDSHADLPVINHDLKRLDSIELMPFRVMIDQGIKSVMVAHLSIPALDPRVNVPSTLSRPIVTDLLKDSLNFEGLIFTDALEMKGVTKHYESGVVEAEAIVAGNDVLCLPENVPMAIQTIKAYIADGRIPMEAIDKSVEKILTEKYNFGLYIKPRILLNNLSEDINNKDALALKKKLITHSITLAKDNGNVVPLNLKPGVKMAILSIGGSNSTPFQTALGSHFTMDKFSIGKVISSAEKNALHSKLKNYDVVIASLHDMSKFSSRNFGIEFSTIEFLSALDKETKLIVTVFGSPYALKYFDNFSNVLLAYNEDKMTQEVAADALVGETHIQGKLPVSAGKTFRFGNGVERRVSLKLGYAEPERVGMSSDTLDKIALIVEEMINQKMAPGCQIFIAKDGKIVYDKSFGYHTYAKKRPVKNTDLYDLASITKVAATTMAVMKLNEEGRMNIGSSLGQYIKALDTTNKRDLKVYDIMAHHAGLAGWIPFYKSTVSTGRYPKPKGEYYKNDRDFRHRVKVSDQLFMRSDYVDSIWQQIYSSELRENNDYRYSDLGFYMLSNAIENVTGQSLDEYVAETFYKPLGLERTLFNPLSRFSQDEIVPSEEDTYFRAQRVHGYVHDMGSAMLGGVAGHAGLFSNAHELGIIMQMLLNSGYYGETQYLKPQSIHLFTQRHPRSSRRGIGFDMKDLNHNGNLNISEKASGRTYGHTGFTGTFAFVDPDYNLVVVILANRTYPSMNNNKYIRADIRERIHSKVYSSMGITEDNVVANSN